MKLLCLKDLISDELKSREFAQTELNSREKKIKELIAAHCQVSPDDTITRAEWQHFCFKELFNKKTKRANIPFCTYLNKLMPELGYPLGYIHTKIKVYRGLKWK